MRSYAYLCSQPTLPPLVIDTTPKEASLSPMEESSASSSSTHSPHSGDATHRISYSLEVGSSVVMPSPQLVLSDGDKSPSIPGLTQSAIVASDKLKVPRTAVSVGPRHSAPTDAKTPIVKVSLTAARNLPQIPPNAPRPASIHPLPPDQQRTAKPLVQGCYQLKLPDFKAHLRHLILDPLHIFRLGRHQIH